MIRQGIVAEARSWLGVAWRHQGRARSGIDCAGLPVVVGLGLGLTTHNPMNYPRRPDGTFIGEFRAALIEKLPSDSKPGDVLVFAQLNHPCHCGIRADYMGRPSVVHSHRGRGKVVEETLEQAQSIVGKPIFCFAYPGVED